MWKYPCSKNSANDILRRSDSQYFPYLTGQLGEDVKAA